jgi:hypothetical protein
MSSRLEWVRERWLAALGWTLFLGLLFADVTGHYIFDPFAFGFSYYIIVVTRRSLMSPRTERSDHQIFTAAIALLYVFLHLHDNVQKHEFMRHVEATCASDLFAGSPVAERLCDKIRSDVASYLQRPIFDPDTD